MLSYLPLTLQNNRHDRQYNSWQNVYFIVSIHIDSHSLLFSFCFAISTTAPTKPLVLFSPFVLFSVFSSLTHCFHSQMETKRTAILLFCFLLSFFLCVFLCFVVGSVSLFLSCVFFVFLIGFSLMFTVVLPLFFWLIGSTKAPTMSFLSVILLLFLLFIFYILIFRVVFLSNRRSERVFPQNFKLIFFHFITCLFFFT